MAKRRSERGRQGPAGPRGERGERGRRGEPGKIGQRGPSGKAAPGRAKLIAEVNGHIDDIYKKLDVQMTRMSQIQQQLDELREKVKRLSE